MGPWVLINARWYKTLADECPLRGCQSRCCDQNFYGRYNGLVACGEIQQRLQMTGGKKRPIYFFLGDLVEKINNKSCMIDYHRRPKMEHHNAASATGDKGKVNDR